VVDLNDGCKYDFDVDVCRTTMGTWARELFGFCILSQGQVRVYDTKGS
jgi:hypothetical protein